MRSTNDVCDLDCRRYVPLYSRRLLCLAGTQLAAHIESRWPKTGNFATMADRFSKVALNMVMVALHSLVKPDGMRTWYISLGFLATGLGGNPDMLKEGRCWRSFAVR